MWMEFQVLAQRLGTEAKLELEGHNFGAAQLRMAQLAASWLTLHLDPALRQVPASEFFFVTHNCPDASKCGNSGGLGTFISLAGLLDTVNLGISGQHGFAASVPLAVSKPPTRSCH